MDREKAPLEHSANYSKLNDQTRRYILGLPEALAFAQEVLEGPPPKDRQETVPERSPHE